MQAVVLSHYGSPENLRLVELTKPEPRPGEVLVKVHASTVNDHDWCIVRGKPYLYRLLFGLRKPKVRVLGAEIAGIVESVGEGVSRFQPGDHVYGDVSEVGLGGFAEYVRVPESSLATKPPGMTFEEAASLPHAVMLAYQGLVEVGRIRQGDNVLINGAGGGVGTLGLQIAKQFAAEVTAVDAGFKLNQLSGLGFDRVIDYQQEDFTRDGRRYDLILDTKTTRSPGSYLRALKPAGRYVTVGGNWPRVLQTAVSGRLIGAATGKQVRIVALKTNKDLGYVNELYGRGGLKCVIDGSFPLQDVAKAVQRFGEAKHIGKIVITVASQPLV